jgi:indole-3-glycerol phosphate synthase
MKNTYLNEILKVTRASVEEKKKTFPLIKTSTSSENILSKESFIKSLKASIESHRVAVIAEMKKASPSQGLIRENYDPSELAKQYLEAEAACLSVLTDEPFFKGSLEHISLVKEAVDLPVLRKDFIVDEYQAATQMVAMTSGAALYVAGLAGTLKEGIDMSLHNISEGRGLEKLEELVEYSKSLKKDK